MAKRRREQRGRREEPKTAACLGSATCRNLLVMSLLIISAAVLGGCERSAAPLLGKTYPSGGSYGSVADAYVDAGDAVHFTIYPAAYASSLEILQDERLVQRVQIGDDLVERIKKPEALSVQTSQQWNGTYAIRGHIMDDERGWLSVSIGEFVVKGVQGHDAATPLVRYKGFHQIIEEPAEAGGVLAGAHEDDRQIEVAYRNEEIAWLTDSLPASVVNESVVSLLWRGSQFGNGQINWLVNGKQLIETNAVGYDRTFSDASVALNFHKETQDKGLFTLTLPGKMLSSGQNTIRAQMIGEEYVGVSKDELEDIFFDEGAPVQSLYGFQEALHCPASCQQSYNSYWGPVEGVMASAGDTVAWRAPLPPADSSATYIEYWWRATHYGGDGFSLYLNNRPIIEFPVFTQSSAVSSGGFKLVYQHRGYADGYSGRFHLYVPRSLVDKDAVITITPKNNSWMFLYTVPEELVVLTPDSSTSYVRGTEQVIACDQCDVIYPTQDGFDRQDWSYGGSELSFLMPAATANRTFTTFAWAGAHYGDISVEWLLNGRPIVTAELGDESEVFAKTVGSLRFDKTGYRGGQQGIYQLRVPTSWAKSDASNLITARVSGKGWVMMNPERQ